MFRLACELEFVRLTDLTLNTVTPSAFLSFDPPSPDRTELGFDGNHREIQYLLHDTGEGTERTSYRFTHTDFVCVYFSNASLP